MNLRNVLRVYSLLRQLSDDESALLNILRALNDNDREQLVASMSDKPQKKSSKKAAGGGGKSKRSESLKGQLDSRRLERRKVTGDDDDSGCDHVWQTGELAGLECGAGVDANVHQLTTTEGYHEFIAPPVSSAAGASGD